ncbi:MAG: hypothetical protein AB7O57_14840 [Hyphomicrobiaceae bacterium]
MHILPARQIAVQAVMVASATLSAAYYWGQAPAVIVTVAGVALNPAALGLAATAAALDLSKAQMLQAAGTAGLGWGRRIAAGLVFAVLFVASMIAVDGMLVKMRSDWAGDRSGAMQAHARAKAELARLTVELAKVADAPTIAEVKAQMDAAPVARHVFRRTESCTDVTRPDSFKACKPILDLRKTMASAIRKAEIEPALAQVRAQVAALKPPQAADPQAEAIAKALGIDASVVAYAMIAILGFALELVACMGLWILSKPQAGLTPGLPAAVPGEAVTGPQAGLEALTREIIGQGGRLLIENQALARLLGVSPATASKWRRGWRDAGEIEEGRLDGRLVIRLGRRRLKVAAAG